MTFFLFQEGSSTTRACFTSPPPFTVTPKEREGERERVRECEREKERESVCVRERERERDRECVFLFVSGGEFDDQGILYLSATDHGTSQGER